MNQLSHTLTLLSLVLATTFMIGSCRSGAKPAEAETPAGKDYLISELLLSGSGGITILGNPQITESPYGDAVLFNGIDDAIFMDYNPLSDLPAFTVEVIMRPDREGLTEQRFIHMGEYNGNRMMLETRLTENHEWYFDGFIKSGDHGVALIDPELLHSCDKWFHAALVMDNGNLSTYINGKKELDGEIPFEAFGPGQTSIGVRQNKVCWYKGALYKIRVTPAALPADAFMDF